MSIIDLNEVSKIYGFGDATTVALEEVNLTIEENEFIAIMGPSGSGKSTLMNVIGLLDRPTYGRYKLSNRSVDKIRSTRRAKIRRDTIGFVFQSFNLLPRLNVIENVALPLAYKGVSLGRRTKLAESMLERVGMDQKKFFYPSQLSSGQIQCVAIARALINNPKIIIADEPTGNLDSASSRLVMELFADIHKSGSTILLVTHNPEITRYASRVVYMRDGSIMLDEDTTIGDVAATAKKAIYRKAPKKTIDDDLAGVSVIIDSIPQKSPNKKRVNGKKKKAPKKRKTTVKRKKI
ncbi:MAG: ABC transporter ATP-binding protein [Candidatus Saccharibacteria bacterium]